MKKVFLIFVISFLLATSSQAQFFYENWREDNSLMPDSTKLWLKVQDLSFFKDNEYFNPMWTGYTLLGNSFSTEIQYHFLENLYTKLGYYNLRFWGRDTNYVNCLYFNVLYRLSSRWTLSLGRLAGNLAHGYIEPMLNPESRFLHPIEQGIQFQYSGTHFKTDIWLDWEHFELWNDPFQEWLTQGTVSEFHFDMNKITVRIPIQSIITHHGGQIDTSPLGVETLINSATGLEITSKFSDVEIMASQYILTFNDFSPTKKYPFAAGRAFYSLLSLSSTHYQIEIGYWYGDFFITTKGNPIFRNLPTTNMDWRNIQPQRSLSILKYRYKNAFWGKMRFDVQFEGYYDIFHGNFDYAMGIYLNLNQKNNIKISKK